MEGSHELTLAAISLEMETFVGSPDSFHGMLDRSVHENCAPSMTSLY